MPSLTIATPVGRLAIDQRDDAIIHLRWADEQCGDHTSLLAEAARQLDAYFAGRLAAFDLPLAAAGSAFEQRVWAAMRAIPYGQTRTYGELAHATNSGPRAVGGACGKNPIPIIVPCHRVLAKGGIGGYSGGAGPPTKQWLLALESRLRKAA